MDIEVHKRALGCIAGGALTNSKRPESYVKGVYPTHLVSGSGAFVTDHLGKKYIDFICGLGAVLYGHTNAQLTVIGKKAEDIGNILSLGSIYEVQTAERIKENFIFIDRLRFLKTGSEACTAAITIARSFTGRSKILSDGYHGWAPEFTTLTPPAHGCPPTGNILPLKTTQITEETAAVIIEPVITDFSEKRQVELSHIRDMCNKTGAVLIFDETITALRFPRLSAAAYFGINPDLIVFGKALGGGSSLACVGGKANIMECEYFVSSTFAGEVSPIMKAEKMLTMLRNQPIQKLWEFGESFWKSFNETLYGIVEFEGYPTRGILKGDEYKKALFMQEACKSGMLFGSSPFLMFAHIELKEQILSLLKDIALKINTKSVKLEGQLPRKPQAEKVRQ